MKQGKLQLVRIGLEETPGTAVVPATELMCYEPALSRDDTFIQREAAVGLAGPIAGIEGPRTGKATLRAHLRSDGAATLEAGCLALLQGCGLAHALGVLTPATALTDQKSLSVNHWADGVKQRLHGAMGDWTLEGESGKPVMLTAELSGLYTWEGAEAVPAAVISVRKPFRAESITLSLGGVDLVCSKFSLKANNPVEPREDVSSPEGILCFAVMAGRRYVLTVDPEVQAPGDWDPATIFEAETEAALSIVLSDGDVSLTIAAPDCQILPPNLGTRGGKLVWDNLQLQANNTGGAGEISLTLAAVPA
jgi:hypothetical protein